MIVPGLEILNCGAGHLTICFDKADQKEVDQAKNMVEDMLRRGYTIIVEDEAGETHRVESFDPEREIYYVESAPEPGTASDGGKPKRSRKGIPLRKARATGIGRTGGG